MLSSWFVSCLGACVKDNVDVYCQMCLMKFSGQILVPNLRRRWISQLPTLQSTSLVSGTTEAQAIEFFDAVETIMDSSSPAAQKSLGEEAESHAEIPLISHDLPLFSSSRWFKIICRHTFGRFMLSMMSIGSGWLYDGGWVYIMYWYSMQTYV